MAAPLLPCAHCGANARWIEYKDSFENYVHAVSCTECPSEMSYHVDALPMGESAKQREAIIRTAWNRRATKEGETQ